MLSNFRHFARKGLHPSRYLNQDIGAKKFSYLHPGTLYCPFPYCCKRFDDVAGVRQHINNSQHGYAAMGLPSGYCPATDRRIALRNYTSLRKHLREFAEIQNKYLQCPWDPNALNREFMNICEEFSYEVAIDPSLLKTALLSILDNNTVPILDYVLPVVLESSIALAVASGRLKSIELRSVNWKRENYLKCTEMHIILFAYARNAGF